LCSGCLIRTRQASERSSAVTARQAPTHRLERRGHQASVPGRSRPSESQPAEGTGAQERERLPELVDRRLFRLTRERPDAPDVRIVERLAVLGRDELQRELDPLPVAVG
jgi:hypothetical protein